MAGDYLYWRRSLHPEWYQSFTRWFVPPHPLPPGQTAITRADTRAAREQRTYYVRHAIYPDRFPPEGQTLLSRADEAVEERSRRYQSFFQHDIKIPDSVTFPEGEQVFTRADERVSERTRYQTFFWNDATIPDVHPLPEGQRTLTRADEVVTERLRYQSFVWHDIKIPDVFALPEGQQVSTRVDERVNERLRSYQTFIDYDRRIPDVVPSTALPPGVQIFARAAEKRELRTYYQRHAIFPDVQPVLPAPPPGKSLFSRADETVSDRFQSLVWSGAVISFVGPLPEGQTLLSRADEQVNERARRYVSFIDYNRKVPNVFVPPVGRKIFSPNAADEKVAERPRRYQSFVWSNRILPAIFLPPPGRTLFTRADEIVGTRSTHYQSFIWDYLRRPLGPVVATPGATQVFLPERVTAKFGAESLSKGFLPEMTIDKFEGPFE